MKSRNLKLLPLVLIAALSVSLAVQSAHAQQGTLYVLPAHTGTLPVNTLFSVKIQVANIDPFNAWDISVQSDPTIISPQSLSITGNLLAINFSTTAFELINCNNGIGTGCIATDGAGIAHSAVTGFGPPPQTTPSSGLLFAITYKVIGAGHSAIHIFSDIIANGATGAAVPHFTIDGDYGTAVNIPPTASFTVTGNNTVTGSTVSFNAGASVDPDGTIASYAWTFGDGGSSTGVTASHVYGAAGTFTVTLTVTDNSGSTGTKSVKVGVVDRPPTASFTVTGNNTAFGSTVSFNAGASADPDGTIASYAWTFGDGGSSTGVTATHVYAAAGTFTVTLTVTDNSGSTGTKSVKVVATQPTDLPPVASFTVTGNNTVTGSTVSFNGGASSDPDGTVVSYAWTFGDGGTGTGVTATHVYTTAGTFTVTLTVTDNSGSIGSASAKVGVVDRPPVASFTVTGNNTVTGSTVSFNAGASVDPDGTIASYAWTFGDGGTATGVTATHVYAAAGTFTPTLTVTDNSGSTGTKSVKVGVVDRPPTASFTVTGNNTAFGSTVSFNAGASADPDGTIASYAWTFGDGGSSTGVTSTHVYAAGGTFNVTLTVTDNSGSTGTKSVKVVATQPTDLPPVASFTVTGNNTVTGSTVSFNGGASSDPDGTVVSYAWTFGDGGTGTGVTATHVYTTAGTFTVTLTVTDNSGSIGSASAKVGVVDRPPVASFTVTGNNTVTGSTVSFNAGASVDPDGTIASYAWTFGDGGTATGVTASHVYGAAGTFTVTLTVTDNSGSTGTKSVKVGVVDRPPTASFTVTGNNTVTGSTVSFNAGASADPDGTIASYAWTFGDGGTATVVIAAHVYATAGTFTVTLTVTDNSGNTGTRSTASGVVDRPPVASFTV